MDLIEGYTMHNFTTGSGRPSVDKPWLKYYGEESFGVQVSNISLYDYLYECNCNYMDSIAVNYYGNKISYRALFADIDRAAQAFLDYGISSGDVVTLVTLSCYASVVSFYALNHIGAISNYVNVLANREELVRYYKDSGSKYVIFLDIFASRSLAAAKTAGLAGAVYISLDFGMSFVTKVGFHNKMRKFNRDFINDDLTTSFEAIFNNAGSLENTELIKHESSVCCHAHTGGTTGFPKTVLLEDKALNSVASYYNVSVRHNRGEVFLSVMIPYVIYGLCVNIHMPLCLGLTTVIIPKFETEMWSVYIKKYRPNHLVAIPAYVIAMLDDPKLKKADLSCFMTFAVGGDGMTGTLEEKVNRFIHERGCRVSLLYGYGMSETCASAVTQFNYAHKAGSVGIPFSMNNVMAYNNNTDTECGYNEIGEICLQTITQMVGYKDNEAENAKLFRVHDDGSVWIHTGDMGYIDEDGFVFMTGRMKRMIMTVVDGMVVKIFPAQVEEVISSSQNVQDVCVVGAVNGSNRVLRAFVIRNSQTEKSDESIVSELRGLCEKKLADNMRPYFYEFCDKFPRTVAGKVDYQIMTEG